MISVPNCFKLTGIFVRFCNCCLGLDIFLFLFCVGFALINHFLVPDLLVIFRSDGFLFLNPAVTVYFVYCSLAFPLAIVVRGVFSLSPFSFAYCIFFYFSHFRLTILSDAIVYLLLAGTSQPGIHSSTCSAEARRSASGFLLVCIFFGHHLYSSCVFPQHVRSLCFLHSLSHSLGLPCTL